MSLTVENFRLLTEKLVERLSHLGHVTVQYDQESSIDNGRLTTGMNVTIQVDNKIDRYFITDVGYGAYFVRYYYGV